MITNSCYIDCVTSTKVYIFNQKIANYYFNKIQLSKLLKYCTELECIIKVSNYNEVID